MALSVVDAAGRRHVEPGPADVWIGGGQPGSAGVRLQVTVKGRRNLPQF